MTACFTSVSTEKSLASHILRQWSKEMENTGSLGRILPTALLAGQCYDYQVTDHPTHRPDLASSNFHLLETLKMHPDFKRFTTDADMKQAAISWLQTIDTDLSTPGHTSRCQGGTHTYVDGGHIEVRYVLSATQVPCVRYIIFETALYKL